MMNDLGKKIAQKRKDLGMTQIAFAEQLAVTRQTVSRWEAGSVLPDIDKITDIADILGVSCDYLLKDEVTESEDERSVRFSGRLIENIIGKKVRLNFFDEEADPDLYNCDCRIIELEGNWLRVQAETKKGMIEKMISLASVLSFDLSGEDD